MMAPREARCVAVAALLLLAVGCLGFVSSSINCKTFRNPSHGRNQIWSAQEDRQETIDTLTHRLARQVLEQDVEPLELLRTRIPSLPLNTTFIGPSTVAGRGLFARIDCRKGDLLTCYPGDALIKTPSAEEWQVEWGNHVATKDHISIEELSTELNGYILFVSEEYGVVGLPNYDYDPAYSGHIANDGALRPSSEADLARYVLDSNEHSNAMHQGCSGCHMVTVATQNIRAGDEIFVTYGPDYWREQGFWSATDPAREGPTGDEKGFG